MAKCEEWLTSDRLTILRGWARNGLTNEEIAKNMGIHVGTLYAWKKKYPEINDALKKGKEIIDNEVEEALIKAALGYTYEETEEFTDKEGCKHTKTFTRYAKPDTTALIFWLKNRRPGQWRDAWKVDMKSDVKINPEEDVKKYRKYLQTEGSHDEE